jgi:hypothetical protein
MDAALRETPSSYPFRRLRAAPQPGGLDQDAFGPRVMVAARPYQSIER